MVNLLRKLFIKNYNDVGNNNVRVAHGKMAAIFGIITNAILCSLKLIFGIIANSISMISDSINNISDMASSVITLVGFKISNKPADKDHPFGHQRIEYITGLIVSVFIIAIAVELIVQSITKLINGGTSTFEVYTLIILGVCILLKICQGIFYIRVSKIINSVSLKASAVDSFTDSIATSVVLICALISKYTGVNIDAYAGLAVSLFIIYSGIKMLIETGNPLIGVAADKEFVKKIVDEILSYEGVLGVHDVMVHSYGETRIFMTVHVEVDSRDDIMHSHDLVDNIEMELKHKHSIELVCHMDPVDVGNPETIKLKEKTKEVLESISPELTFHDFRVVHGDTHTNIIFDIVVPFDFTSPNEGIIKTLNESFNKDKKHKYNFVINIDRPFTSNK